MYLGITSAIIIIITLFISIIITNFYDEQG